MCRASDVKPSCLPGFICCAISPTRPMYTRFKVFILFYFVYSPIPSRSSLTGTAVLNWIISISPSVEHELRAKQPGFPLKTTWRARHWAWKKVNWSSQFTWEFRRLPTLAPAPSLLWNELFAEVLPRMFSGQLFLGTTDLQRAKSPHLRQRGAFPPQIGQHSGASVLLLDPVLTTLLYRANTPFSPSRISDLFVPGLAQKVYSKV